MIYSGDSLLSSSLLTDRDGRTRAGPGISFGVGVRFYGSLRLRLVIGYGGNNCHPYVLFRMVGTDPKNCRVQHHSLACRKIRKAPRALGTWP